MSRRFREMLRWELAYALRRRSSWVYFLASGLIGFGIIIVAGHGVAGLNISVAVDTNTWINTPLSICEIISLLGLLATPAVAAFAGQSGYRDYETGMYQVFFTTPLSRWEYVGARFIAVIVLCALLALSIGGGVALATRMPFLEQDLLGPFRVAAYVTPVFVLVLPTMVVSAALFFGLATLTRRPLAVQMGGVALLTCYMIALGTSDHFESKILSAIVDPTGLTAVGHLTQYWSIAQQRVRLVWPVGIIAVNRIVWTLVGFGVFAATLRCFRFAHFSRDAYRVVPDGSADMDASQPLMVHFSRDPARLDGRTHLLQLWTVARRSFLDLVWNRYFAMTAALSGLIAFVAQKQLEAYGTTTYPVTYQVVVIVSTFAGSLVTILIAIYAGELVWHERTAKMHLIVDATPTPTWVLMLGKLVGLFGMIIVFQSVMVILGIMIQTTAGYFRFELGQYATSLLLLGTVQYCLFAVLCIAIQAAVQQRYAAYAGTALAYIIFYTQKVEGMHQLLRYGSGSDFMYSDMNGYGPFVSWLVLWQGYWMWAAVLLTIGALLLWARGSDSTIPQRLRTARRRLTRPVRVSAGAAGMACAGFGAMIFYNTNIRHTYLTPTAARHRAAAYERLYKRYADVPQPRITAVRVAVDIFPDVPRLRASGVYMLRNRTGYSIDTLQVQLPETPTHAVAFDRPAWCVLADSVQRYYLFRLATPLAPGDSLRLTFDLDFREHGFTADGPATDIVANGTFVNNTQILPSLGYDASQELTDPADRSREHLDPRIILPVTDARVQNHNVAHDADFITLDATLSTSLDQIAVIPGDLRREWVRHGRRYFHYTVQAPIQNFFAVLSARYAVYHDQWHGVAIEIDYHPAHAYNLGRMAAAVKRSLDYYTTHFGPYQYRQVRIVEFPRYADFAQSFPNMIPYSEAIGFIARVHGQSGIDYPYYVTAHEVAHQWWAHQVIAADGSGSAFVTETMAQYSALMVMEQAYGKNQMRRFLGYELHRYLRDRTGDKDEKPLVRAEGMLAYTKGALAMYALRDYLGEARLNAALAAFIAAHRFRGPPYVIAPDLITALRAVTPDSLQGLVTDLFERITLYDLKVTHAQATRATDGRYLVTIQLDARKAYADSDGQEDAVPMHDWIDLGVYADTGAGGKVGEALIYLQKHRVVSGKQTVRFTIDRLPARVGIDPLDLLVNRSSDRAMTSVVIARGR